MFQGLAVVGRLSRVKSIEIVDSHAILYSVGVSKLMMAKVCWRKPIFGEEFQQVIVAHLLNNILAKSVRSPIISDFWVYKDGSLRWR